MKRAPLLFVVVACQILSGCGRDTVESETEAIPEAGEVTLAERASSIALRFPVQDMPLSRLEQAVVTLPEGATQDGARSRLDLWVDRGVPNAAVSHAVQKKGGVFRRFAQLRNVALEASVDGKIVWQPKMMPLSKRPSLGQKIEGAEPPSQDADQRLSEMKVVASRFTMPGTTLKPDPVYRYESSGYGVVDGGAFVFMDDGVRAILVIEAFKGSKQRGWQYKVNRFTSPPGSILFDGEEIRSWSGYWVSPRSNEDEYVEQKIDNAL